MPVLLLIDTAGCGMEERVEEEGDSKSNDGEAQVRPFSGPTLFVWPHMHINSGGSVFASSRVWYCCVACKRQEAL